MGIYVKYILANISHFYKENICKIYFNYKTFCGNIFQHIFCIYFFYMELIEEFLLFGFFREFKYILNNINQ